MLTLALQQELLSKLNTFCLSVLGYELNQNKFTYKMSNFGRSYHFRLDLDWISISGRFEAVNNGQLTIDAIVKDLIESKTITSIDVIKKTGISRFVEQLEHGNYEIKVDYFVNKR